LIILLLYSGLSLFNTEYSELIKQIFCLISYLFSKMSNTCPRARLAYVLLIFCSLWGKLRETSLDIDVSLLDH